MKNGYFVGKVYNDTLAFDREVFEGWNYVVLIVGLDETLAYTRLRLISYARSQFSASTKTFSYKFIDDTDYDLVLGGHYSNNGEKMQDGFAGNMLEFRLYSTVVLTLTEIDY